MHADPAVVDVRLNTIDLSRGLEFVALCSGWLPATSTAARRVRPPAWRGQPPETPIRYHLHAGTIRAERPGLVVGHEPWQ